MVAALELLDVLLVQHQLFTLLLEFKDEIHIALLQKLMVSHRLLLAFMSTVIEIHLHNFGSSQLNAQILIPLLFEKVYLRLLLKPFGLFLLRTTFLLKTSSLQIG